jgi:hypothetical protein
VLFKTMVSSGKIVKCLTYLLLLVSFLLVNDANSSGDKVWSVGIMISDPSGVSVKYWLTEKIGFASGIAWEIGEKSWFYVHLDYLKHNYKILEPKEFSGKFPLYYGIGLCMKSRENNIGVRIPVGVEYIFKEIPFTLFGEVVCVFIVSPKTSLYPTAALGARFVF